jgi:antirestriction protein ArdC
MMSKTHDKINEIVISGLKTKGLKWFKPWKASNGSSSNDPVNWVTRKPYNGINVFMLNASIIDGGYNSNEWLTFKQCSNANGKIIKGMKATDVFFWQLSYFDKKTKKYIPIQNAKSLNLREKIVLDGKSSDRYMKVFNIRNYKVFNIDQCEGLDSKIPQVEEEIEEVTFEPIEVADQLVKSYVDKDGRLVIDHKDNSSAFYRPMTDSINMPLMDLFVDADSYYKTLFHEMAHATGHQDRLNRKTLVETNGFGTETYSREELVAEITSMYMVGYLGLDPKDNTNNSQAYINGWIKHLTSKPQEIATAMTQASKAFALLVNNSIES